MDGLIGEWEFGLSAVRWNQGWTNRWTEEAKRGEARAKEMWGEHLAGTNCMTASSSSKDRLCRIV